MTLKARPDSIRRHQPRFLAHPFELAVSLMAVLTAIRTGDVLTDYEHLPHIGLLAVPAWLLWLWVVMAGLGGLLMLTGITWGILRARARLLEAAGLWLTASVWAVVAVADFRFEPTAWWTWGQYLAIAGCSLLRLWGLRRVEKAIDRAQAESEAESEAGEGR